MPAPPAMRRVSILLTLPHGSVEPLSRPPIERPAQVRHKEAGMSRGVLVAVSAAILIATSLASPARAGGWQYDPAADLILYDSVPVAPWYRQRPWIGTGPGHYYSYYPTMCRATRIG
jgi:hypothetical protein